MISQVREARKDAELEAKERTRLAKMPKRKREQRDLQKREREAKKQRAENEAWQIASILLERLGLDNLVMVYAAYLALGYDLSKLKDFLDVSGDHRDDGIHGPSNSIFGYTAERFIAEYGGQNNKACPINPVENDDLDIPPLLRCMRAPTDGGAS